MKTIKAGPALIATHDFQSTIIGSVSKGDNLAGRISFAYAKHLVDAGAVAQPATPTPEQLAAMIEAYPEHASALAGVVTTEDLDAPAAPQGAAAKPDEDSTADDPIVAPAPAPQAAAAPAPAKEPAKRGPKPKAK